MLAAAHENLRSNLENAEAQLHNMSSLHDTLVSSSQLGQNTSQQNYLHQNVDFAKVFDNDDLNQLFYESFKHDSLEPTPLGGGSGMSKSNSLDGLALLCNSSYGALNSAFQSNVNSSNFLPQASSTYDASAFTPSSAGNSNPLVNVMFIVDPATQKVICPRQTLHYQVGHKTENQVVGPTVLSNSKNGSSHTPNIDIQQLLQQNIFSPANNLFGSHHSVTPPPPLQDTTTMTSVDNILGKKSVVDPADLPPLRALSAYNFFFRDERDRVLNGGDQELNEAKAAQLLQAHWSRDRTAKRRHRKTHGKIDFTTLSKLISSRWKKLSQDEKEFYRQVAARDWERYQKELGEYKNKISIDSHLAVVA